MVKESDKPMTTEQARKLLHKSFFVETSSGIKFEVRRLNPMDYIRRGISDIPSEFYSFVTELQKGTLDLSSDKSQMRKNFDLFEKFLTITLEEGIVAPPLMFRLKPNQAETHLLYSELPSEDQVKLLDAITGR